MNARVMTRALIALGLLTALLVVSLVGRLPGIGAEAAGPSKDFTVTAAPISSSVQKGRAATFSVAVTPVAGFTGKVTLSSSGLAAGMSATFSPSSLTVDGSPLTSTLTVTTSSSTPTGSDTLTVTGTNGSTKRTLALVVVVSAPAPAGLALAVTPAGVSVAPGSSATYAVAVSRINGYAGTIGLVASAPLPTGTTVSVSPSSVPAGASSPVAATLTVTTTPTTPASTTAVTVTATGASVSPVITATGTATLVVDTNQSSKPFSIAGNAIGALGPGVAPSPVDLTVTNPNNQPLHITDLGVTVTGTSRAGCAAADFTVRQYAGSYPLTVAAHAQDVRLVNLGVPLAALPTVAMLDGARNQDACTGVTVRLAYTGSATNQ